MNFNFIVNFAITYCYSILLIITKRKSRKTIENEEIKIILFIN